MANFTSPPPRPGTPWAQPDELYYGGHAGGAQEETQRNRVKAGEVGQRQAYQADMGQSNESRGFQMGSLAKLDAAASGNAPSQAALQAKQSTADAIRGGMSMAASTKGGPGARVAAMRAARAGAAQQTAQGANLAAQMRAKEMETARGQLAGAATATRGTDLQAAGMQQQAEIAQRQLNDQSEQFYEGQGSRATEQALNAAHHKNDTYTSGTNTAAQIKQQGDKNAWDKTKDIIGIGSGIVGGLLGGVGKVFSDPAAKQPIMGSLSSLDLGGRDAGSGPAAATFAGAGGMESGSPTGELQAHSNFATQFQSNPGAMPSDMSGKDIMRSDMNGKDVIRSDKKAKKRPFDEAGGLLHRGYVSGDAEKDVAARRKRGGYDRNDEKDPRGKGADDEFHGKLEKSIAETPVQYGAIDDYEKGVAGAPKGYAAAHPRSVSDDEGSKTSWLEPDSFRMNTMKDDPKKAGAPLAPGSDDWARYGANAAKEGEPNWAQGGATKPAEEKPGFASILSGVFGDVSRAARPPMVMVERDTGVSDPKAKQPVHEYMDLYQPPGMQLQQDRSGHAYLESEEKDDGRPRIESRSGSSKSAKEAPKSAPKSPPKRAASARQMTPEEMMAAADAIGAKQREEHAARMNEGPSVSDPKAKVGAGGSDRFGEMPDAAMADAMRSMEASPYAYKEQMRPSEQAPGEVNIGPMANKMAEDPVARTAIVRDPETDLLAIDKDKGLKVVMGSLASLQDQIDDMNHDVPRAVRAKKARRYGSSAQS